MHMGFVRAGGPLPVMQQEPSEECTPSLPTLVRSLRSADALIQRALSFPTLA
jgi:hypothetical protein